MRVLYDFLIAHRDALIDRCRLSAATRRAPQTTDAELSYGVPVFLDQLIKTLQAEQAADFLHSRQVSGSSSGDHSAQSEIGTAATVHGLELLQHGFTIDQVVHDYGDRCQAITHMIGDSGAGLLVEEFQTLNRCLDNAIAEAVAELARRRETSINEREVRALNERMGILGHELRNLIHIAKYAFDAVKRGKCRPCRSNSCRFRPELNGLKLPHRPLPY